MAFRPRKRAASQNPRVYWNSVEQKRILGFAGYKVGMTHISFVDNSQSPTKGQEVTGAATVIEVPPIYVYGYRLYAEQDSYADVLVSDANILGSLNIKKPNAQKDVKSDQAKNIRLLVFVQPSKTKIGKKHVERMEIGIGGKDVSEKLEYAKSLIGKELRAKDVFKHGEFVDVVSITKGKGWQGAVKRFGVAKQRRKATGKYRHVGTLGQWHPAYVLYTVPQAGQMGYHKRTELNKQIMKISEKVDEINPKDGFPHYGFVMNDYLLLRGSVPGPTKRLVKLRLGVRSPAPQKDPQLNYVSLDSKQ